MFRELQVLLEPLQELCRELSPLEHDLRELELRAVSPRALPAVVPRCVAQRLPHRLRTEVSELLLEARLKPLPEKPLSPRDTLLV